jgi:hypothetical protein
MNAPAPASNAADSPGLAAALDPLRFDAIAEFAGLAASYWLSIEQAAMRQEQLTIETHCRQVSAVTRQAFSVVKLLGSGPDERRQAA